MNELEFDQIVKSVASLVMERGSLEKPKFRNMYPALIDTWPTIRKAVIKYNPQIVQHGQSLVRRRLRTRQTDTAGLGDYRQSLAPAEQVGFDRIQEIMTSASLQRALGRESIAPLESLIKQEHPDRSITRQDLAYALICKLGTDLLSNIEVRSTIAKSQGLSVPKKWIPGSRSAHHLCRSLKLPSEFAGSRRTPKAEVFETISGGVTLRPLAPFQQDVVAKLTKFLNSSDQRAVVEMPTGAGKTRVCMEALRDYVKYRQAAANPLLFIWVAQKEELLDQAAESLKQIWQSSTDVPTISIFRNFGVYRQSFESTWLENGDDFLAGPSILLTTPQSYAQIALNEDSDLARALRSKVHVTFIDECHLSAAPSYDALFSASSKFVGASATAFSKEYQADDLRVAALRVAERFEKRLITPLSWTIDEAMVRLKEMGVLSRLEFVDIKTKVTATVAIPKLQTIDESDEASSQAIDDSLALQVDSNQRRRSIFTQIESTLRNDSTRALYFGPSVLDAELMCLMLRFKGITAAVISGKTLKSTRRQIISDFKNGNYKVLCNCQVLTTGFDDPLITHIILARPTVSRVLYEQMIGRGLRGPAFGGTATCTIFDVQDDIKSSSGRQINLGRHLLSEVWQSFSL